MVRVNVRARYRVSVRLGAKPRASVIVTLGLGLG